MTTRDVYVGELGSGEALDWGGEPRTGNLPTRIGPFFPGYGAARNPHETLIHFIDSGVLKGRKVDWGAYAAKITVAELRLSSRTATGHVCRKMWRRSSPRSTRHGAMPWSPASSDGSHAGSFSRRRAHSSA